MVKDFYQNKKTNIMRTNHHISTIKNTMRIFTHFYKFRFIQKLVLLIFTFIILNTQFSFSQSGSCSSSTPYNDVNLTSSPTASWTSGNISRNGQCCGIGTTYRCVEFKVNLHPNAIGVKFEVSSGTVPSGSQTYRVNCGAPVPLGQATCLNGPGPHYITFCTTGTVSNRYRITSISQATPLISFTPSAPFICENDDVLITASGASTYT